MGLARSTYHDVPVSNDRDAEIVARIKAVSEEFEAYGYRRMSAELRHQELVVNSKSAAVLARARSPTQAPPTLYSYDRQ